MTDRFINKDYIVLGANAAQIVPEQMKRATPQMRITHAQAMNQFIPP